MRYLLLLLTSTMLFAYDETWEMGPGYHEVSDAIQTPSWPWALELPGGLLKTLLIANRSTAREAQEVRQRLAVDWRYLLSDAADRWTHPFVAGLREPDNVLQRADEALQGELDLIVVSTAQLEWGSIPSPIRLRLLERVAAGTGMLVVGPEHMFPPELLNEQPDELMQEMPEDLQDAFPGEMATKGIEWEAHGDDFTWRPVSKGRIVRLDVYKDAIGVLSGGAPDLATYEDKLELVIRAMRFAAGQDAGLLATATPSAVTVQIDQPQGKLEAHLFDAWNRPVGEARTIPAQQRHTWQLPELAAGHYWYRLKMTTDAGCLATASLPIVVRRNACIRKIEPAEDLRYPGKTTPFKLQLIRPVEGIVKLSVYDADGRWLSEQEEQLDGQDVTVSVQLPMTRTIVNHLHVAVVEDGQVTDQQRVAFGVQQPLPTDDFTIGFWGPKGGPALPGLYLQRALVDLGIDYGMFFVRPDAMDLLDYAGYMPRVVWEQPEELPWPYDETFRSEVAEKMKARLMSTRVWSPPLTSLGDEASYRYTDRSPAAMAAFRAFLQQQYGDIEALNAAWGSSYQSWDEVERIERHVAKQRFNGNLAAGYANDQFILKTTGDFFAWQEAYLREILPTVKAGPEGIWGNPEYFYIDYLRLVREQGYVGTYTDKDTMAIRRSFGHDNQVVGPWYGGYFGLYGEMNRVIPWQSLLEGLNSAMWFSDWPPRGELQTSPLLNPGWEPNGMTAGAFDEIRRLKQGIGKLLLGAERHHDDIVMIYPTISYTKTFATWTVLLESTGCQVRFMTLDETTDGYGDTRMVVLSSTQVVNDQAAETLENFVKNGGIVLMDEECGVYDSNGTPRETSAFTSLRAQGKEAGEAGLMAPAVRRLGDGWLVNIVVPDYELFLQPAALQASLYEVLETIGFEAGVRFSTEREHTLGLMAVRYTAGDTNVVALHRQKGRFERYLPGRNGGWDLHLTFDEAAHQFDMYTGTYIGHSDELEITVPAYRPALVSRLPYRPAALRVEPVAVQQGELATTMATVVDADGNRLTDHEGVVHLGFADPAGNDHPRWGRNLVFTDGQVQVHWQTALNEVPGTWHLNLRDAATGISAELSVTVSAR